MKTRLSYVSNSSSSSFCIVGVPYNKNKFNIVVDSLPLFETIDRFMEAAHDYDYDFDAYHEIEDFIGPLMAFYDENDSFEALGVDVDEMHPDETRSQFFSRVLGLLRQIGYNGNVDDLKFYSGSYRI